MRDNMKNAHGTKKHSKQKYQDRKKRRRGVGAEIVGVGARGPEPRSGGASGGGSEG